MDIKDNTVVVPAWAVQWDEWSVDSIEDGDDDSLLFLLIYETDYVVRNEPACTAILLRLTRRARGQYERIGFLRFHGSSVQPVLAAIMTVESASENLHLGNSIEKQFTIELI